MKQASKGGGLSEEKLLGKLVRGAWLRAGERACGHAMVPSRLDHVAASWAPRGLAFLTGRLIAQGPLGFNAEHVGSIVSTLDWVRKRKEKAKAKAEAAAAKAAEEEAAATEASGASGADAEAAAAAEAAIAKAARKEAKKKAAAEAEAKALEQQASAAEAELAATNEKIDTLRKSGAVRARPRLRRVSLCAVGAVQMEQPPDARPRAAPCVGRGKRTKEGEKGVPRPGGLFCLCARAACTVLTCCCCCLLPGLLAPHGRGVPCAEESACFGATACPRHPSRFPRPTPAASLPTSTARARPP